MNVTIFEPHALPSFGLELLLPSDWCWNQEFNFFIDPSSSARLSITRVLVKGDVWRNTEISIDAQEALVIKQLTRTDPHMVIMGMREPFKANPSGGFIIRIAGIRGPSFHPQNRIRSRAVLVCLQTPVDTQKPSLGTALIELRLDLVDSANTSLETNFLNGLRQSRLHALEKREGSQGNAYTASSNAQAKSNLSKALIEKKPLLNRVIAKFF
jgi:hypothetical protein